MSINLISYSQPPKGADYLEGKSLNALELIAYCARVSNPANKMNTETSDRLIKYLVEHKHWSPFEMVNACLEIDTTRDIARQILRHRSFSFQEFSQRYSDPLICGLGFTIREARLQDSKNRQNSLELDSSNSSATIAAKWDDYQRKVIALSEEAYLWATSEEVNIAKEVARAVLPEGLTNSTMMMNGTIRSWIHYIDIREGKETQKEHREIALACAEVINTLFPIK